jgi:hypothetical protein
MRILNLLFAGSILLSAGCDGYKGRVTLPVSTGGVMSIDASPDTLGGADAVTFIDASPDTLVGAGDATAIDASPDTLVGAGDATSIDASPDTLVGAGDATSIDASPDTLVGAGDATSIDASTDGVGDVAAIDAAATGVCLTGTAWNLARDLLTNVNARSPTNPFADSYGHPQVWHMMFASGSAYDPATYSDIPTEALALNTACGLPVPGYSSWPYTKGQTGINTATTTINGVTCAVSQVLPPLQAFAHPGPNNLVLFAWQSPVAGSVSISGTFMDDDCGGGNGVAWRVDHSRAGSVVVMATGAFGNCGSGQLQLDAEVAVGDYLYFIVDPNGDQKADLTGVIISIVCS